MLLKLRLLRAHQIIMLTALTKLHQEFAWNFQTSSRSFATLYAPDDIPRAHSEIAQTAPRRLRKVVLYAVHLLQTSRLRSHNSSNQPHERQFRAEQSPADHSPSLTQLRTYKIARNSSVMARAAGSCALEFNMTFARWGYKRRGFN